MPDSVLFGRFALLLDQRRLLENDAPISLGARAFDLLATLVQHRDRVVSKDELLTLVWRDAVVEENNLSVQISTLRKVLGADALQTVVGQGYRFTLAVSAAPAGSFEGDMVLGLPDKPSIAVLPFDCVGNGWTGMHLVDTMGDDLIDALSRLHSIFVISRHSVQSYRGRAVHPREVARELGVRYVLEGSVRRLEGELRIAAALIDALTGQQIWSEGYAWGWGDGSAPQHAIVRAIVIAMVPHIEHSEIERARLLRPQSSSAYALAQRRGPSRAKAFRVPTGARGTPPLRWRARRWPSIRAAAPHSTPSSIRSRGTCISTPLRPRPWQTHSTPPRAPWPSTATTPWPGVIRLSPRDPTRFHLLDNLVWAQFAAQAYGDAIHTAEQSLREADFAGTRLCLVLCLVGAGQLDRAAAQLSALKTLAPDMVAARLQGVWLATDPEVCGREVAFLAAAVLGHAGRLPMR